MKPAVIALVLALAAGRSWGAEAKAALDAGNAAYLRHDLPQALAKYAEAVQLDPREAQAYSGRGCVEIDTGKFAAAIEDFDRANQLKPNNAGVIYYRGVARAALNDGARALADFDQAIALKPDYANAYDSRGVCHFQRGELTTARADFDRAIDLNPDFAAAYLHRGLLYAKRGIAMDAVENFNQALRLSPGNVAAYAARASAYSDLGAYARALNDYDEAIRRDPHDFRTLAGRGAAAYAKGNYAQAISDFTAALGYNADLTEAYYIRSKAYHKTGDDVRALAGLDEFLRRKGKADLAYNEIAWILATSATPSVRNGPKAVDYATEACVITQWRDATVIDTLVVAYAEAGNFKKAIKLEKKNLKLARSLETAEDELRYLTLFKQGKAFHETPAAQ
jgi:tetratricopeptide (TPR) repeat protein